MPDTEYSQSLFVNRSDALAAELRETPGEQGHILGSILHASCVLLGSAMTKASCEVINKDNSKIFELGNEMRKM